MAIAYQLPLIPLVSINRSECREWSEPCRLTACRYHLGAAGGEEPCILNRAEAGPMSCEEIAPLMGMSDENVRLIELDALVKITPGATELAAFLESECMHIAPRILAHMTPNDAATLLDELDPELVEVEELPPEADLPPDPPLKSRVRKSNPNQGNLF